MCPADCHRKPIIFHNLAQEFRPVQGGDSFFFYSDIFGVVRMYGSSEHGEINVIGDVFPGGDHPYGRQQGMDL